MFAKKYFVLFKLRISKIEDKAEYQLMSKKGKKIANS